MNGERVVPLAAAISLMALAGCTTVRVTEPSQTATEQLLVSTAVDHAVERLKPTLPAAAKVFVDTSYFDTAPADGLLLPKYAIGTVRDALLRQGAHLVDNKKAASVVVELRTGGASIDHDTFLIGIPSFSVPIPLAGAFTFPQIALYERDRQTGLAKLAVTAYDTKSGALAATTGPRYGTSDRTHYVVLLFVSWTRSDLVPPRLEGKVD